MYFGSVKFFKHLIVGIVLLIIIVSATFAVVFGIQLNDAKAENEALKSEIGEYKLSGRQSRYTDDELFMLYKENLEDKEGFLKLAYEYDSGLYKAAVGLEAQAISTSQEPDVTVSPVTSDDDSAESDEPDEIYPNEAETTDENADTPDGSSGAEQDDGLPAHSYETLYPELYAELPDNIVYNEDIDYVYLTFDDGPSKYTQFILDYLRTYDIKATFFVVPDGTEECRARLKAIADAGHTIGIHTATHEYNKIYESVESFLEDFKIAYDRVYEATGIKCNLYRYPGGSINDYNTAIRDDLIAEMNRRGFIYFDWNVDSSDALGATWTEMYNNVLSQTREVQRAVILMHDYNGGYNTILVLEDIIKALINDKRGFKLDKLTEYVKPVQF